MLNICRASAGSGKTHKLTGEYIRLLFSGSLSDAYSTPKYKRILAVTFTNKATDEMKHRILQELYLLSTSEKSDFLQGILALDSIQKIRKEDRISFVQDKSRTILIEILNDYTSFNVNTIDRFFQSTLRAFAREVGQYSSYNVEIDQASVLMESVDLMMESLEDNIELLEWLIQLSIAAIEDGGGWDSMPKVLSLGKELFSEDFKLRSRGISNTLASKDAIKLYREKLTLIIKDFQTKSIALGKKGVELLEKNNLHPSDFSGGSRSAFFTLSKLADSSFTAPSNTFFALADNIEKWYTKKTPSDAKFRIEGIYSNGLNALINDIVELHSKRTDYNTAKITIKDLYSLGILHDIQSHIQDYCRTKNIVLLSETTDFLNKIIDGSDTPFIYEKIGGRIEHYMLDEFQDTSLMQWSNFKPLIQDSLDSGKDNLIVGDVKQSIYRWRSSDWSLLNEVLPKEFDPRMVGVETLSHNWRSLGNIVEFNNIFFKKAGEIAQDKFNDGLEKPTEMITDIYSSLQQSIPDSNSSKLGQGHIKIQFLEKDKDDDWKMRVKDALPEIIDKLRDAGYSLNDIAFLVRTNAEGADIADCLLRKGYNIISEDSLLISSSRSVERIVTILKNEIDPDDAINKFLLKDSLIEFNEKSLYSICEEIIRSLEEVEQKEDSFLQAFMDCVINYVSLNGSDIRGFVKWWEKVGRTRSVSAPEGEDAIRILTIHKSKGLGFKAVIIPYLTETLYRNKGGFIWTVPNKEPFTDIGLVPITLGKGLEESIFSQDYLKERLYSYVDSLNLAYVAFTRAKSELIIFAPKPKPKQSGGYSIETISDILYFCCESDLDEKDVFEVGSWSKNESDKLVKKEENIESDGSYVSIPIGNRLKLSYSGADFFKEDNMRSRGVIFHDILSRISTVEDLPKAINEVIILGQILESEYEEVFEFLSEKLDKIKDRNWFNSTYPHYNELTIISPDGSQSRPDRVMISDDKVAIIDYKFGKIKSPAYNRQVQEYVELYKEMGYSSVNGYIWYVEEGEIDDCCRYN